MVNTNHAVAFNAVLNQKHQSALERILLRILSVTDLSGLTMGEEDLVASGESAGQCGGGL